MTEISMLKLGDRFSSFADAKKAIEELGENTYTTFWKRDARTIASSKIVRPIESSLIYYQLLYACNHGGKKFKSSGKNIRQSWTFKEDCPVHVRFKASSDGKALEVTSVQMKHNHVTSKVLHARNPSQRKLSSNMKESVKDYLNMKANKKMTQQKFPNQTKPNETYTQTRKKCLLLCMELADLAAQRTGILFEQRLNVLKNLKTLWANDTNVGIVPVDENQTQFFIGSDDELVFESKNQSSVEHSEICDEMDLQGRNKMSEALILDNRNTSTLGQSPVETPEFCNELVIEEEMTPDEAHQHSYY
ncbi:uncharacterized protein LOC115890148 [Sitophilus oryzae]|uniref:Uncharacterized protein LOC115890148 n=1 Tax=Sitophilus oryzae TaxID=7048 RepID=A0A6J2YSD1_SITOR|nr:uncharacterized protein LOC115890148 [Sitophilus oryzae]XP_030766177.1 uncharacterized protein LOC115890148 [Sitophilus oryzae]XP_030766184.1 uncharacterized protein LOC115890148 [Sitophilus oryzae]